MWRTTWRSLLAHKLRLAFSGLAIVLGVAFVAGTMIFTDTLNRTFTALFESTAADVGNTAQNIGGAIVNDVQESASKVENRTDNANVDVDVDTNTQGNQQ